MPVKEEQFVDDLTTLVWTALGAVALGREDRTLLLKGKKETVLKFEFGDFFPVLNQLDFETRERLPFSKKLERVLGDLHTVRLLGWAAENTLRLELDFGSAEQIEQYMNSISHNEHLSTEFGEMVERLKWLIIHPEEVVGTK
jgi:hypothetical protein